MKVGHSGLSLPPQRRERVVYARNRQSLERNRSTAAMRFVFSLRLACGSLARWLRKKGARRKRRGRGNEFGEEKLNSKVGPAELRMNLNYSVRRKREMNAALCSHSVNRLFAPRSALSRFISFYFVKRKHIEMGSITLGGNWNRREQLS